MSNKVPSASRHLLSVNCGADSQKPDLMHELLPQTQNHLALRWGNVYRKLNHGTVPNAVRTRQIPEFIPAFSRYDVDLGIITSFRSPNPQARYSQYVFELLQSYRPNTERKILAQVYAITTLMARLVAHQPLTHDYVSTNMTLNVNEVARERRRMGWRIASRLAIDAVVTPPEEVTGIETIMQSARTELEADYQADFRTGSERSFDDISVVFNTRRETPTELISSIFPVTKEELNTILFTPVKK